MMTVAVVPGTSVYVDPLVDVAACSTSPWRWICRETGRPPSGTEFATVVGPPKRWRYWTVSPCGVTKTA